MREVDERKTVTRAGLLAASAVIGLLVAPGARAQALPQSQAAKASTGQAASESTTIGEVVVTAQRRSENLQNTPVAVTAMKGVELQKQGQYSLNQVLEAVPSTSIVAPVDGQATLDSPGNVIAIRGIGSNTAVNGNYGASVVPAVGYYVDDVLNGIGGDYDLAQVQVLRGPQGTLYGRSATAGAFIARTFDPELGRVTGDALSEFGNYDLRHVSGGVNIPLGDKVAVRASGNIYKRDGYYAPNGGQVDIREARIKALFDNQDNFKLLVGAAFQHTNQFTGEKTGRLSGTGTSDVVYDIAAPLGTGSSDQVQYWAKLTLDLGPVTLTYIPAWRTFYQDTTFFAVPAPGVVVSNNVSIPKNRFHTEELRLASNSTTPLTWQAGVFYYDNNLTLQNLGRVSITPPPGLPPLPGRTLYSAQPLQRSTQNVGVFAEATYHLTPETRLTAGLRYDYTKVQTSDNSCTGPDGVPLTCLMLTASEGTRTWNNVTYKARIEHDLSPENMIYATASSAFLPGDVAVTTGANGLPMAAPYEAETLNAFEIGSKNRFLSNRLQVNAAAFYYIFGGHQLPVVIGVLNPGNIQLYQTLGAPARARGAEVELIYQLTNNDTFALNASYVDAYYVDKPPAFAAGVAQRRLANVVPWNIAPSYTHTFNLPHDRDLVLHAEAIYRSSYLVNDLTADNAALGLEPYLRNGDTVQANLSATLKLTPNVSLTAYARNVTDVRYKTFVGLVSPVVAANGAQLSDPRTYGVTLAAHF